MNSRLQNAVGPARKASFIPAPTLRLQRECACGQQMPGGEECEECKKKHMSLQRHSYGAQGPATAPPIVREVVRSPGDPLDAATRTLFEPRFGHDFSQVRVHTNDRSAASARTVSASAYTVGNDVVFGSRQYSPSSARGQMLLAHELTHVVQQQNVSSLPLEQRLEVGPANDPYEREADEAAEQLTWPGKAVASDSLSSAMPRVQRAPVAEAATGAGAGTSSKAAPTLAPTNLLVDDDAEHIRPGQMRKMQFLDKLQMSVCATADEVLTSVGRTAKGCPYIERWIGHLRWKSSQFVERGIRKYAPDSAGVTSAEGYIPFVAARVRRGVMRWARTGEISEVPDELRGELLGENISGVVEGAISKIGGALGGVASLVASGVGKAASAIGGLFAKERDGGVRDGSDPRHIQAQLGSGQPLDSGVRSRMETSFGADFSPVRVHQDSTAAGLSTQLNARAFTVGLDVAFGAGEYRPGTLIGDALIAHELAHVVQQGSWSRGISRKSNTISESSALEEDADLSAVGAVASLWGGAKGALKTIGKRAGPSLRSGLRLQRCGGAHSTAAARTTTPTPTCAAPSAQQWTTSVAAADAIQSADRNRDAKLALVQQALCPLSLAVVSAGNRHLGAVDPEDYQPMPAINFDVNLNQKQSWPTSGMRCRNTPGATGCTTHLLEQNYGYNFRSGSTLYVVLGPHAIASETPAFTQRAADHERYLATTHTAQVASGARNDPELDTWVHDFIGYFHLLGFQEGTRYSGSGWEPLLDRYYEGPDTSDPARTRAVDRLVAYYNNPPSSAPAAGTPGHPTDPDGVRTLFRLWMRKMLQRRPNRQLILDLQRRISEP